MDNKLLTVSLSPHIYDDDSVSKIMKNVIIALIPAFIASILFFGFNAIRVTLIACISCVAFEYLIQKFVLKGKTSVNDFSAIVTGILLAFNLPSNLPAWMIIIGCLVAIGVAKMSFGGLGKNPFNPALVGRVFLLISFPVDMTSWPKPLSDLKDFMIDGQTAATPLAVVKEGLKNSETIQAISQNLPSYLNLFIGKIGGCIGEVSAAALLLGLLYMLYKKIITWHIPIVTLLTVFIFTSILWLVNPDKFFNPIFHIFAGGIMLGAIFMATDMVTSPMTPKGMIIFSIGIGCLTVIIRTFGAYPEGVSFAILIMNAFVPLINKTCRPKKYGVANG